MVILFQKDGILTEMSFEYGKNKFTTDPHVMLQQQILPVVHELQPGSVYYINPADIAISEIIETDGEIKAVPFVDRYAALLEPDDVIDEIIDAEASDEEFPEYVRIVGLNEGILLDSSHEDVYNWQNALQRYGRLATHSYHSNPDSFIPVIHWIFNKDELELVEAALADNNIVLDPDEFELEIYQTAVDEIDNLNLHVDSDPDDDNEDDET